jgi:hypothetical protein
MRQYIPLQFLFLSIISLEYQGQFPTIFIFPCTFCPFSSVPVTAWLYWEFFSVYLFLISCVECLVICIDSFEFLQELKKSNKRKASCTYFFRDHFSCFVKNTRRDSYFLTVNLNALCFFEI